MARHRLSRGVRAVVLLFTVLLAPLPAPGDSETIPHPAIDGVEPAIAEQIRELRARVDQAGDRSAAEQAISYAELGALYHSLKFTDAALACYRNAESLAPGDGRWPYLQGVLYTELGEVSSARRALLEAIALNPELSTGWVRLGRLALGDGDPRSALLHFQRALNHLPESAAALAGAGQALLELDRPREAVEHLEKALEIEPRANRLNYPLAMAYRDLGERHKMQALLKKVGPIGVTVDDPVAEYATNRVAGARVHMQQGNKAYRAGDYTAAMEYFTRAAEASPDMAPAWTNLGAAQGALGNVDAAKRSFRRALEITPSNITALENLVSLLMDGNDEKAALKALNEHLPDDSDHRVLRYRRAELRRLHGDPAQAAQDYKFLTELVPNEASAWMGLLVSRIQAGKHDTVPEVLADARQALGDPSSLERELVDALVAVGGGDAASADLARRLADDLYQQQPGSDNAFRVARTLLMGRTDCAAAERWLDEQIGAASGDESLHGELVAIRDELRSLARCGGQTAPGSEN